MLSRLILPGREEGEEEVAEMEIRLEINSWTVEEAEALLLFDDAIFLYCLLARLLWITVLYSRERYVVAARLLSVLQNHGLLCL